MKTITLSEAFRRMGMSMLLLALALTKSGCGGGMSSNPGGGSPPPASIAIVSPTSGAIGTSVTITGSNFGANQGTSTVKFNGTAATPTRWSATSIVVPVPAGATTGNVVVTVGGVASNGMNFTVTSAPPPPSITSLNPTSGPLGSSVTISGANFGTTQGSSTVKFSGTIATPASWSATSIVAAVPATATTGNVVVTVGGVASNGVSFTVTVPAPSITSLNPTSGAVGTSVTITGANFGATQGSSTVTFNGTATTPTSWSGTSIVAPVPAGATTGNVVVTVGGVASNGVSFTVSSGTGSSMGPLKQSTVNTRYFVTPAGNGVFLAGSHTWDDFQDTVLSPNASAAFPLTNFVNMIKSNGQNATILWYKDLPTECNWNSATWNLIPQPWMRSSISGASDGGNKFDLSTFNQAFFDRMRSQVMTLQQNGIYAIVELFDANNVTGNRCGNTPPGGDGYPLTGVNNINSVDDGYTSGAAGVGAYTMMTNNAVTGIQDAYVIHMIDTLNDLPNVLFEIAEEEPGPSFNGTPGYGGASSLTFWAPHVFGLIHTYEKGGTFEGNTYPGKPFQHPVGIGPFNFADRSLGDGPIYSSAADWVAPAINGGNNQFPSNCPISNQGKVCLNDADHALGWSIFVNSSTGAIDDVDLRSYIWENVTSGAGGLLFMDPYVVYWPTNQRNPCSPVVNGICTSPMAKYDPFRKGLGVAQGYVNGKMDLVKATPQGSLSSTGFCLADNAAAGAEYLVYAPSGGTFTVNLSATTRALNVEWLNPATGATVNGGMITGGSTNQSFTVPFNGDAVLYIVDQAGHN